MLVLGDGMIHLHSDDEIHMLSDIRLFDTPEASPMASSSGSMVSHTGSSAPRATRQMSSARCSVTPTAA